MPLFDDDPRTRRLKADYESMKQLKGASTILDFVAHGDPPERYVITFKGKGLKRKGENDPVEVTEVHRCEIQLGIDYPRSQPYLKWITEIYHPNIAVSGAVCLGGYSTNWSPALGLDELCEMLWDMVRFANYDTESPYNYRAAQWAKTQTQYDLPVDTRPLRDKVALTSGSNVIKFTMPEPKKVEPPKPTTPVQPVTRTPTPAVTPKRSDDDILFIDDTTPVPTQTPSPNPRRYTPPSPRGGGKTEDEGIEFVE